MTPKLQKQVDWISQVLLRLLKQIVARRLAMGQEAMGQTETTRQARMAMQPTPGELVLDEMAEVVSMPAFDARAAKRQVDPDSIELPVEVEEQLKSFVVVVALMYQDNPFHCFVSQNRHLYLCSYLFHANNLQLYQSFYRNIAPMLP